MCRYFSPNPSRLNNHWSTNQTEEIFLLKKKKTRQNSGGALTVASRRSRTGTCLVSKKFYKIFQIFHHIGSLDAYIEY
jgi:hypothetical protein